MAAKSAEVKNDKWNWNNSRAKVSFYEAHPKSKFVSLPLPESMEKFKPQMTKRKNVELEWITNCSHNLQIYQLICLAFALVFIF